MKAIICLRPVTIGGKRYRTGDRVSEGSILPGREKHLEELHLIAVTDLPDPAPAAEPAKKASGKKAAAK